MSERVWLTEEQAAEHLGWSRYTLRQYKAPHIKLKRLKRYHRETLDKWAQCLIPSTSTEGNGKRKTGAKSPTNTTRLKSGSQEITLVTISEALEKHQSAKPGSKRAA